MKTAMIMKAGMLKTMVCICIACAACGEKTVNEKSSIGMTEQRQAMIQTLLEYGIRDQEVLRAMLQVRRHTYIPEPYRTLRNPYGDHPCPIGYDQTISQPYIVAYMTTKIDIERGEKVLEIGTGSGYQAAVLAELGATVYSIEIIPELAAHARGVLHAEGYDKVKVKTGDGYLGWPEHAPFDAIIVTCAPDNVPGALVEQLKEGGRMMVPVGAGTQRLVLLEKRGGRIIEKQDLPVRFVPMVRGEGE